MPQPLDLKAFIAQIPTAEVSAAALLAIEVDTEAKPAAGQFADHTPGVA
jgi:hypothetical protein